MVIFCTIILILLVFLMWLLIMPVTVVCNTSQNIYEVRQRGTFCLKFILDGMRIVGYAFGIRMKSSPRRKTHPEPRKEKKGMLRDKSFYQWVRFGTSIIKTFRIQRLRIDLDTGDSLTTALLIPAGIWVSRGPVNITGNFEGRADADIELTVSLYKLTWAFLRFLI